MGKINVLGFDVANLIAAGEVVDRPASIVKELLENAVDSGADCITLEIKHGGISHIRVSDNGCGIEYDDLPLAVLRHATSKIKNASDLEEISTLGFRGEALAAIASVTKMKIYSRTENSENGSFMVCEGGEIVDLCEAGCAAGTTVIADELFYNVPARRKFLKRDATECAKITEIAERVALSAPDVSLKYTSDGVVRFMTQGDGNLKNAIHSVFGRETAERLIKVDRSENGVRVSGYVSDADRSYSKRSMEIFFVNGRFIKSPIATAALERAYVSKIPSDKFPMCVLNISIAPGAVDVNVHPTKLEVKFSNERVVSEAVHFAVLTALNSSLSRPEIKIGAVYGQAPNSSFESNVNANDKNTLHSTQSAGNFENPENYVYSANPVENPLNDEKVRRVLSGFAPVGRAEKDKQLDISSAANAENGVSPERSNYANDSFTNGKNGANYTNDLNRRTVGESVGLSSILAGYDLSSFEKNIKSEKKEEIREEAKENSRETIPDDHTYEKDVDSKSTGAQSAKYKLSLASDSETETESENADIPNFRIIGEAYDCYVIVELEDRILLIDKHAAHERIIFDELCERRRTANKDAQMLLAPVEFSVSEDELPVIDEYSDDIRSIGFDFTADRERHTVSVTQIPSEISAAAAADMLGTMISRLCEGLGTVESAEAEFFEKALYQASCKAAIKGGRYYGIDHIKWICRRLLKKPGEDGKVIKTCPHGRPVAFEIKKTSIERQFSRID